MSSSLSPATPGDSNPTTASAREILPILLAAEPYIPELHQDDCENVDCDRCVDTAPLASEREAEIREHVASTTNFTLGNLAARDLLAELDRVRAEVERLRDLLRVESRRADAAIERETVAEQAAEEAEAELRTRIAELEQRLDRRSARLLALENDALSVRGTLAPADGPRRVPMELGESLVPAVEWLVARVAELEAERQLPEGGAR